MQAGRLAAAVFGLALLGTVGAIGGCNDGVVEPGVSCGSYVDDAPGTFSVTVENTGDAPIFVANVGCSTEIGFRILGGAGAVTEVPREPCDFTCGELTMRSALCTADCAAPRVVAILPGGRFPLVWSRRVRIEDSMPSRCYLEPSFAASTCDQLIEAPDGAYGVEVDVHDAITCGTSPCDPCEPNADGYCDVPGFDAQVEGIARIVEATFELPRDDAVVVPVP